MKYKVTSGGSVINAIHADGKEAKADKDGLIELSPAQAAEVSAIFKIEAVGKEDSKKKED